MSEISKIKQLKIPAIEVYTILLSQRKKLVEGLDSLVNLLERTIYTPFGNRIIRFEEWKPFMETITESTIKLGSLIDLLQPIKGEKSIV